jgi:hypothetical protein
MGKFLIAVAVFGALALGGCGKVDPAEPVSTNAGSGPPTLARKCPDPSIKDSSNLCSPNYYKSVKGSFKGQKSF